MAEHDPSIGATSEWLTPPEIFDALGLTFDLDPCSPAPGHSVPARKIYTKADDGLPQPWESLVWVNPPFGGRNGHVPWLRKFLEHRNGIAIVRAYSSSAWFNDYAVQARDDGLPERQDKIRAPRWIDWPSSRARIGAARNGRDGLRRAYEIRPGLVGYAQATAHKQTS